MLGLPKATELHKQLPKKAVYANAQINTAAKGKIDADISRITIVNEVSPARVQIAEGEQIKAFFVVHVALKKKDFDKQSIELLPKYIPQKMLFVLEYGEEAKLAVYHTKLLQTAWQPKERFVLALKGLTLDAVWENIVLQIGNIQIESGNTLNEQIALDDRRHKLEKEINRLEKLARKERQPKKKFEMVQRINGLKKEWEETYRG